MEDFEQARGATPEVAGYDVGRQLGRGGNAAVWLVTEQATGRDFALKCFPSGDRPPPKDGDQDGDAEAGMRREVRILSALDHEHLVKAHSVVRLAGAGLGLVLDHAAGGSLAELLAGRGRLGAAETVTVLTPIAQALAYLHGHGFTHGDVSPGNVLFTAHGKPLLADLGVARMVADSSGVSEAGTEGFRDPAPVDAVRAGLQPERDVYSLAAVGWYCLTGRAPGRSAQRPPLPLLVPEVPAALAAALEAGLNEDRRQRPGAAELAAAVYRSAEAAPVDLSVSVHPTVLPQLLTRRALPRSARERSAERLRGWLRRTGTRRAAVSRRAAAARHSAGGSGFLRRRGPARRGGYRALSTGCALGGAAVAVLAGAWLIAGGRLPWTFPDFGPSDSTAHASQGDMEGGTPGAPDAAAAEPPAGGEPDPGAVAVSPELRSLLDSADPEDAVRGLAGLRSLALSSSDFGLLAEVNVPASPAALTDGRISSRLTESGHVLAGFSTTLTRVEDSADSSPARAVVAITAASSPYQERDAAGSVVAEAAAGGELRMRLVLVPVDGRWRIQDILPEGSSAG
ncbi:MAG: serine/threonine protein kinase [Arthrobacter sp.]|nr:serine/threonine protein kinase [Arthrobacter sp.]